MGTILEEPIRTHYLETTNQCATQWDFKDVEKVHPDYPFLIGHLDGWNAQQKKILECKSARYLLNALPYSYILQVAFYCAISGAKEADIAVLSATHDFKVYRYTKNENLEELIVEKAVKFWDSLEQNSAPDPQNLEDIRHSNNQIFNKIKSESLLTTPSLQAEIDAYYQAKKEYEKAKKEMESRKLNLVKRIGKYDTVCDKEGIVLLTYKFDKKPRETIDKALLKDNYPDIWEKVSKRETPSRRLFIKEKK